MKYFYKFVSLLTISVLMFSSYASYATGCCCVKGGMDKAEASKSEMPCHNNMSKNDGSDNETSNKMADANSQDAQNKSEGGKCCSGKCDCKFTVSVKLPTASVEAKADNIEFSFLYFYTHQKYNSVSPESLDAPPKA